jgi:hypothetical protein
VFVVAKSSYFVGPKLSIIHPKGACGLTCVKRQAHVFEVVVSRIDLVTTRLV